MPRFSSDVGYRAFLELRHVLTFFTAALIGRLSFGMVGLALLLQVHRGTGSYAAAGLALAGYGLTAALFGPLRARWVDGQGRRRALPILALSYGVVLSLLAAIGAHPGRPRSCYSGWPRWPASWLPRWGPPPGGYGRRSPPGLGCSAAPATTQRRRRGRKPSPAMRPGLSGTR
jgi:MFS family permease